MSTSIQLHKSPVVTGTALQLSSSKSISNRALMLNALSGNPTTINNLSVARDTKLMLALVSSNDATIDVMDAGTTMRFLTAYFSVTGKNKIMTGTSRMKERPIALLVDALRAIGVTIDYLEREGFPPVETKGFAQQKTDVIAIPSDVSSQYISALMMIAPRLPKGLTIQLSGKIGSVPYIQMTAALMKEFGVDSDLDFEKQVITVKPGQYRSTQYTVEADWSSSSYWFGFTALAHDARIILPNVSKKSLQGDRVITDVMDKAGVRSEFLKDGSLLLTKKESAKHLYWDFSNCPDLAQTVLPVCALKEITGEFVGLESLRIKETDRIAALQAQLAKVGATLTEPEKGKWHLTPGAVPTSGKVFIDTYHDHRMAMGFAPWATLMDVVIEAPEVVNKSYPGFWDDVRSIGIKTDAQ